MYLTVTLVPLVAIGFPLPVKRVHRYLQENSELKMVLYINIMLSNELPEIISLIPIIYQIK